MSQLNNDSVRHILSLVDPKTYGRIATTNKSMHKIIQEDTKALKQTIRRSRQIEQFVENFGNMSPTKFNRTMAILKAMDGKDTAERFGISYKNNVSFRSFQELDDKMLNYYVLKTSTSEPTEEEKREWTDYFDLAYI